MWRGAPRRTAGSSGSPARAAACATPQLPPPLRAGQLPQRVAEAAGVPAAQAAAAVAAALPQRLRRVPCDRTPCQRHRPSLHPRRPRPRAARLDTPSELGTSSSELEGGGKGDGTPRNATTKIARVQCQGWPPGAEKKSTSLRGWRKNARLGQITSLEAPRTRSHFNLVSSKALQSRATSSHFNQVDFNSSEGRPKVTSS